jgi:hypothetical protein
MAHRTAEPLATAERTEPPPDIATMRATVNRLLDPDAVAEVLPPAAGEVDTLTRTMRGQLALLIPDIEDMTGARPENVAQYCALACIGEASSKLSAAPKPGLAGAVAYARRLARVLNALCDHYEHLGSRP